MQCVNNDGIRGKADHELKQIKKEKQNNTNKRLNSEAVPCDPNKVDTAPARQEPRRQYINRRQRGRKAYLD